MTAYRCTTAPRRFRLFLSASAASCGVKCCASYISASAFSRARQTAGLAVHLRRRLSPSVGRIDHPALPDVRALRGIRHARPRRLILLFNAMLSSLTMVYDRETGAMRSLLVSPFPRSFLLISKLLGGVAVSLLQVYAFC